MVKISFGLVLAGAAVIAAQAGNPNSLRGAATSSDSDGQKHGDNLRVNLLDVLNIDSDDDSKGVYFNLNAWAKTLSRKYTPEQFIAMLDSSDSGSLDLDFPNYISGSADKETTQSLWKRLERGNIDLRNFFGSGDGQVRLKDFVDAMDASDDDDGSDLEVNLSEVISNDSSGSKDVYFNMKDWIKAISKKMPVPMFLYRLQNGGSASLGIDFNFDSSDLTSSGSDGSDLWDDFGKIMGASSRSFDMRKFVGSGEGKVSLKAIVDAYDELRDDSDTTMDGHEAVKQTASTKARDGASKSKGYKMPELDGGE